MVQRLIKPNGLPILCREWTLVKAFHDHLIAEPLKCKCWSCDYCAPYRRAALRAQALDGKPTKFITLTVNPARGHSPDHRARMLVRAWRLIRLRAIRKYSLKSFPFIAVFEATQAGEPHLHILARVPWISQRWLSAQMAELTDAPIVDIRQIKDAKKAANYVAKYIGKDPHSFNRCKRYWASHDYKRPPGFDTGWREGMPWRYLVERMSVSAYAEVARIIGYEFVESQGDAHRYEPKPHSYRAAAAPP